MPIHRILVVVALAVTVAASLAVTAVAQSAQRFDDVPTDHYAFEAIDWMVDNQITGGCGDGSNFCPDQTLTRAHIAAFLHRYHTNVVQGETTAEPTTTAPAGSVTIIDSYWSADGETYYVKLGGVEDSNYCEVHMTLNGRRTGDWSNDLWSGTRSEVTIAVSFIEHDADAFEVECS